MDGVAELNKLPVGFGREHCLFELGDVILGDEGIGSAVEDEDGGCSFSGVGLEGW